MQSVCAAGLQPRRDLFCGVEREAGAWGLAHSHTNLSPETRDGMDTAIGIWRLLLTVLFIGSGAVITLPLSLLPWRFRGARWSAWWVTLLTRVFNRIFNLRIRCEQPERLRRHHGLIFPNHSTYLDPIALLTVTPVRFLAAAEISRQPFVAQFTSSVESVYVDRANTQSRRAARRSIATVLKTAPFPPLVLFPEGRLGPGRHLMPFRHGAFALAVENEVPYMLCALRYSDPDVTTWYGGSRHEPLMAAVWRLAKHRGRITVDMLLLETLQPTRADAPALLALVAQRRIEQALGFPAATTDLEAVPPARFEERVAA